MRLCWAIPPKSARNLAVIAGMTRSEPNQSPPASSSSTDSAADGSTETTAPAGAEFHDRVASRIKPRKLECSHGRIADITGSGMRMLLARGDLPEVGDVQSYTFRDDEHTIEVKGTVKWVRTGCAFARRCEVGVEFVRLDQRVRDALLRYAVQGRLGMSHKGEQPPLVDIEVPNLYTMLGVVHCASDDELKAAYRKECRRWHPDVNDTPEAAQRFDELNKAYSVLKDPDLRARYDQRYGERFQKAA